MNSKDVLILFLQPSNSILGNAYIMSSWPHVLYLLQLTNKLVMETLRYGANTSESKIILQHVVKYSRSSKEQIR